MSSQQRVVREVRTVTEGGVTKQITTETTYSSGEPKPTLQPRPGQTVTRRIVTAADGTQTIYTSTESSGSHGDFPKEFADKLFLDDPLMENKRATASSSKPSTSKGHSATSASAPVTADSFAKDCLAAHNKYRAKHGVPPLTLSKELNKFAEEWAKKLAKDDKFEHRPNNKYGENLYTKWSSNPNYQVTGAEGVDSWYNEIKDHVFGKEPRTLASGHFTQVIWKTTKEMGVAFAKSKTGKILVVANYNPAGNLIGSFTQNVPAPKK